MRNHTRIKDKKCDKCDAAFWVQTDLEKHKLIPQCPFKYHISDVLPLNKAISLSKLKQASIAPPTFIKFGLGLLISAKI